METIFSNSIMQYGAVGVIFFVFIWLVRNLLCNNKKLIETNKELTKQYSNHVTENTVALIELKNEISGQKDILRDIRDCLKK